MSALGRKLWRDLWHIRTQAVAIALVVAVGVANLVMSQATLVSLRDSRDRYYDEHAFADLFVALKRAPLGVAADLAAVPGVRAVDARIVAFGSGELPFFDDPVQVQALSIPEHGGTRLNRMRLLAGRAPMPGETRTLAINDAFAEAHGLRPGDPITLVLRGKRQAFRIVAIAGSPEFVAQMQPGAFFPDFERFAIVWMPRQALEAAMDLDGAFNSATLALDPRARPQAVLDAVDRILARYGGTGAVLRADQLSHRFLNEELRQLATMARLFPAVFLGVAAFVLHVVLGRLVAGQREQIAVLKAFGYGRGAIFRHYAGFALCIAVGGALLGLALGAWLGELMAGLYRTFYRLPFLDFQVPLGTVVLALAVSTAAGLGGATHAVLRAARLPPAEAMRPDVPWGQRLTRVDRSGWFRRLSQPSRLILRNLLRRPLRSLLTVLGLAMGCAVMMMGRFQGDAIDLIVGHQFRESRRHDISVAFVEPVAHAALHELAAIPGVLRAEAERGVAVVVRHRQREHRIGLQALVEDSALRLPLDREGRRIAAPPTGVLVTDYLAGMLDAKPGDTLVFEALEGRQRTLSLPLAGTVSEYFGVAAYLPLEALNRLLGDGDVISGALLAVDPARRDQVIDALERRPRIASIGEREVGIRNFYESMGETLLTFTLIATLFGAVITFGVVYNSARVTLSERARDLASLRVLGFTENEVSYILLGEIAVLALLAVPLGFVAGNLLVALLVSGFDSDLFRIPHHVSERTYALAGLSMLAAAIASGFVVWRRVARLDMIGVLKARE